MSGELIPTVKKSIENFLYDEEGKITRNKILTVGSMMILMGIMFSSEVFAAHSSHVSHSSHTSHSSHSSGSGGGGHYSHSSHESHSSHSSGAHSSHSSGAHSSHNSGSTSGRSISGGSSYTGEASPTIDSIKTPPSTDVVSVGKSVSTEFTLPDTPKIVNYE